MFYLKLKKNEQSKYFNKRSKANGYSGVPGEIRVPTTENQEQ
jgi:hypothetical protein